MPENELPYGRGFRLAWCPTCVEGDGQAVVVAIPPGSDWVRCNKHGASQLAPPLGPKQEEPLGPKQEEEARCVYPVGRTTCGYTRADHSFQFQFAHPFTPKVEK